LGVRPGAHVVLLVEDAVDFAAVFWACLRSGLTAVPLTSVAYEGLRHRQPGAYFVKRCASSILWLWSRIHNTRSL
jgi:acyl-CoA synthetase (AMP-forming)/AMP-acid ligase II